LEDEEMSELKACPFCAKPFIFREITDPGIELAHESKDCPLDGFMQWFETKEQAINSMWNNRPIEDTLQESFNDACDKIKRKDRKIIKALAKICFHKNSSAVEILCDAIEEEYDVR
jgi:hypothetical protein